MTGSPILNKGSRLPRPATIPGKKARQFGSRSHWRSEAPPEGTTAEAAGS